ncbi:mucin-binding protein, partial [Leuconostoc citreum]
LKPGNPYPVDPSKPGVDTPIHYQANDQKANVTYVDQTTGETIKTDHLTGKSDQTSDYRTKASIDELTKQGYELVSDNYPANGVVFDRDDQADQNYNVVLKHKTTIVTPENPGQPGQPIDPSNPNGPKYPNGTDKTALHQEINQTVNYVDEQGKTVATSVRDQVSFDRTGTIDQVTGAVSYTPWQAKNNDNVFDAKQSPVINGYYADKANIPAQTITPDTKDQVETVTYHKLGSLVPDVPGSTPVPYPNDPS